MAPDKPGLLSIIKTPGGAAVATLCASGLVFLMMSGVIQPSDLRRNQEQVVSDKEAMKLYIQETARSAAEEVMKKYDDRQKERWDDLKDAITELRRSSRYASLRSEAPTSTKVQ